VDARVATLRISDSGPGIAEELRRRLFQPFASGDPRSGSGLGLAICQDIVRSLGGEIRLDSRIADGRTAGLDAVVSLPLADNAAA
jgi:two-component system sensor histidine kinase TctE